MTTTQLRAVPAVKPKSKPEEYIPERGRFFAQGDFLTWIMVNGILLISVFSLIASDWPLYADVIVISILMSVTLGLILARSDYGEFLSLLISSTYGLACVLIITALLYSGGLFGASHLFEDMVKWGIAARHDGINREGGELIFTILVALLFWFLAYNASWYTYRVDRIVRVIFAPGLIMASNMIFVDVDVNLEWHFALYLFLAFMLVIRANLNQQRRKWHLEGIATPRGIWGHFIAIGAAMTFLVLVMGWVVPTGNLQGRLDRFQEFINNDPLQQWNEFWNRLFPAFDGLGKSPDYFAPDELDLSGAIRLGDQEVFYVEAPSTYRYFWMARAFDTYSNGQWRSSPDKRLSNTSTPFDIQLETDAARVQVEQSFIVALNSSRLVYAAPQTLSVDLKVQADLFYTRPEGDPLRAMNISVIRPQKILRQGDEYTATSLISTADAYQLRLAGVDYPQWVADHYLQVSSSVTSRTIDLAHKVVAEAGATNPYDQAKAIEYYLRTNIEYQEQIPRPPENQDPVDWVLFDFQQGYCNYYASAMVVMLRSLGVPSRMAAGFAMGTFDEEANRYVVTERDAHTWVEAYFPGYGWIEFEPTSTRAPIVRPGDDDVPVEPPAGPQNEPTPTPTPQPTATPFPTSTPEEDNAGQENPPTLTPTITPTPSPTPTATPVIVPTSTPPPPPPPPSIWNVIWPALSVFFGVLILFVILLAIGAFIYWWWEWRGLRGLSPISRAYARLQRYAALIGIFPRDAQTTEERRHDLVRQVPQAERPITAISRLYMIERYSPARNNPVENQQRNDLVEESWLVARSNILRRWLRRFQFWRR